MVNKINIFLSDCRKIAQALTEVFDEWAQKLAAWIREFFKRLAPALPRRRSPAGKISAAPDRCTMGRHAAFRPGHRHHMRFRGPR